MFWHVTNIRRGPQLIIARLVAIAGVYGAATAAGTILHVQTAPAVIGLALIALS